MLGGELRVFRSGARAREFAAQQFAGAEEARFHRALREAEGAGRGRNILLMKVEEQDGIAIFGRQGENSAADGLVTAGFVVSRSGDAGVGRLGYFIKGQHGGRDALQLRSIEVGSQGKEPGGESRVAAPLGQVTPRAKKGFLGHLLGALAIAAEAPGKIDQRRLPAADDGLERCVIAGENAGDTGSIGGGTFILTGIWT